jgi:Right handed beta helix region
MKKILAVWFVLLLFVLVQPGVAQGQIYYVDPNGSDTSGDGSPGKSWASIRFAATQVQAGDTLLINPGIYGGGILVEADGTASEPITFRANGEGVIIEGSGGERDAFFIDNSDYIIVEGITIQHAERAGLRISWSDHVSVRGCTFADNGRWGLFTDFSNYTLVEESESYGAALEHGIYISNSSDYPTIRHNRLHHNQSCGLHMNGDISMGGDGVISSGLIEGNIIYENGIGGGSGINMDGVTDTIIRNNLLYNNHASGISLYQIDGGTGSQNNLVLNNTIVMPADGRWAVNIPDVNDTNNQLFNNILYNHHSWRGSIAIAIPALDGFTSDYNVVVDRFSADDGNSLLTFSEWQTLGYDTHSLIAAPVQLFVNASAGDYHLKPGSPAIDRGIGLSDVTDDLEGHPRPAGTAYDLGAYEFALPPVLDQMIFLPLVVYFR